jgi:hypothetical protein
MNTIASTPRVLSLAAIACCLLAAVGCKSDITDRTYEAIVRNESSTPVTVWLTKVGPLDGEVYEKNWKSPEDLAVESRSAGEMIAGYVVRPGETVSTGAVSGRFHPQNQAILRVYMGSHNFSDLLAINKGDPDRRDLELDPGSNSFTVMDKDGMTFVKRQDRAMNMSTEAPAPPAQQK